MSRKGKFKRQRSELRRKTRLGKQIKYKVKSMRSANTNLTHKYHAFRTYDAFAEVYQQTHCGIYIKPNQNNIDWPWCEECKESLDDQRKYIGATSVRSSTGTMIKVIGNKFHLPKYLDQMGDGDFKIGEWRQTSCGVLVQFGKQKKSDTLCQACVRATPIPFKKRAKVVEAFVRRQAKSRKHKVERIPEVTFTPTAATLTLIQGERNGISS